LFKQQSLNAAYRPYAIENIESVQALLTTLEGFNVTYPYKESIIPYLSTLDSVAQTIGAVNVVHQGKGYNTDWIGFRNSLRPLVNPSQRALLLGTGGVSKAIQYAMKDLGIDYTIVSRTSHASAITYEQLDEHVMATHTIIVNCTPLGMHPYADQLPNIPYHLLTNEHLLYDCIYNPERTLFLQQGELRGCKIKNGLEMLHLQADCAWEIWHQQPDK
jgi:shikimate dehydrogenase